MLSRPFVFTVLAIQQKHVLLKEFVPAMQSYNYMHFCRSKYLCMYLCMHLYRRRSLRKGYVLRYFAKFKGKHLCQSLFLNRASGLQLCHRCFPVNSAKFLRTTFTQNTSGRLLLLMIVYHSEAAACTYFKTFVQPDVLLKTGAKINYSGIFQYTKRNYF